MSQRRRSVRRIALSLVAALAAPPVAAQQSAPPPASPAPRVQFELGAGPMTGPTPGEVTLASGTLGWHLQGQARYGTPWRPLQLRTGLGLGATRHGATNRLQWTLNQDVVLAPFRRGALRPYAFGGGIVSLADVQGVTPGVSAGLGLESSIRSRVGFVEFRLARERGIQFVDGGTEPTGRPILQSERAWLAQPRLTFGLRF